MVEFVLAALAFALIVYAVFGGADFGAGMIEAFLPDHERHPTHDSVDVALAPVWEANHVWLVLAVVLAFVGFPGFFALVTTHLHLPLLGVLLGVVARGTAFTFRHYDPDPGALAAWYTRVFRAASLLAPLFLGVSLAAIAASSFPSDPRAGFYALYIAPWNTAFCWTTGGFVCALFAFEGAALLAAEHALDGLPLPYVALARTTHAIAIACGALVFAVAYATHVHWIDDVLRSPLSIAALALATLLIVPVARAFDRGHPWLLRLAMAAQVSCVLFGFFAAQFPVLMHLADRDLTFRDAAAPPATLHALIWALSVGLALVLPGLAYLIRVYKAP